MTISLFSPSEDHRSSRTGWLTSRQPRLHILPFPVSMYPFITLIESLDAKVHKGFYETWTSIRDEVFLSVTAAFKACGPTCTSIAVVGHSLGGALSTLSVIEVAAAYPSMNGCTVLALSSLTHAVFCMTTGSPRVGNAVFAQRYNELVPNTQRLVSNDDEVPHLPGAIFGYQHVGTEVWERTEEGQITYTACAGGL
jgi:predicted lipase